MIGIFIFYGLQKMGKRHKSIYGIFFILLFIVSCAPEERTAVSDSNPIQTTPSEQPIIQSTLSTLPSQEEISDLENSLQTSNSAGQTQDEDNQESAQSEGEGGSQITDTSTVSTTTSTVSTTTSTVSTTTSTVTLTTTTSSTLPAQTLPYLSDEGVLSAFASYKPFFQERKEMTPPSPEVSYSFTEGSGKVLLSAPHSTNHIREGSVKIVDYCTGPLIEILHDLTNAPIIYLQYQSTDPNYYNDVPYKTALSSYLENHPEIELVIDIHGAAEDKPFDVDLGTMNGNSLFDYSNLPEVFGNKFHERGIMTISDNYFTAQGQSTVTKFAAGKNVDAVQVEINRAYRCKNDSNDLKMIRALESIIKQYQ